VSVDEARQHARDDHPSGQAYAGSVYQWHGLIEHARGETACCNQPIEVTNLVGDATVIHDLAAMLSNILHEWSDCAVTILVTVSAPSVRHQGPATL